MAGSPLYSFQYGSILQVKSYSFVSKNILGYYSFCYGNIENENELKYPFVFKRWKWGYPFSYLIKKGRGCYRFRYDWFGQIYHEKITIGFPFPEHQVFYSKPFEELKFPEHEAASYKTLSHLQQIERNWFKLQEYLSEPNKRKVNKYISDTRGAWLPRDAFIELDEGLSPEYAEGMIQKTISLGKYKNISAMIMKTTLGLLIRNEGYLCRLKELFATIQTVETDSCPQIFAERNIKQMKREIAFFLQAYNFLKEALLTYGFNLLRNEPLIETSQERESVRLRYAGMVNELKDLEVEKLKQALSEFFAYTGEREIEISKVEECKNGERKKAYNICNDFKSMVASKEYNDTESSEIESIMGLESKDALKDNLITRFMRDFIRSACMEKVSRNAKKNDKLNNILHFVHYLEKIKKGAFNEFYTVAFEKSKKEAQYFKELIAFYKDNLKDTARESAGTSADRNALKNIKIFGNIQKLHKEISKGIVYDSFVKFLNHERLKTAIFDCDVQHLEEITPEDILREDTFVAFDKFNAAFLDTFLKYLENDKEAIFEVFLTMLQKETQAYHDKSILADGCVTEADIITDAPAAQKLEPASVQPDLQNEHNLTLWKRFWFLYAGDVFDRKILPCHDFPYEEEPIEFSGFDDLMPDNWQVVYPETFWLGIEHHPVKEGKDLCREEIPLAINIMVEIINILILMWYQFYPAFWGWTGTQAVIGITVETYNWLMMETSQNEQDNKNSRIHYDRCYQWLRWEAEKVSLMSRNDMELRGNFYVGILLEELINYMLDHHFDVMPVFEDVNKMDEWRRLFDRDLQHDITWVLDKIKGIRHKLIVGKEKKYNV